MAPAASLLALPDGMRLELLSLPAADARAGAAAPPLLFLHGSYHGAWCWAEHFMPFFSAAGYDTYAVSVRGQGGSDRGDLKVSGDLSSHAADLACVLAALPRPPVLVGHSFGGLLLEK
jgi:pimeloyl-ACP methyl ester carboxylesterase